MATEGLVRRQSDGDGVEILTLENPPVNALSSAVFHGLAGHFAEIESDAASRCVIVTGDGALFSAGADLKEVAGLDLTGAAKILHLARQLFAKFEESRLPLIAALNGLTAGGGLELALACDLRVAADSAKLGSPEVGFGLMPAYGGTQRLARSIGPSHAKEMIFTGNLVTAADALRLGLVDRVVETSQVVRSARETAHLIATRAPRAIAGSKRAITKGLELPLLDGLRIEAEEFESRVLTSSDLQEGLRAFAEKRPPKFKGS